MIDKPRLLVTALALVGTTAALATSDAASQAMKKKRSQPTPVVRSSPDVTGTIPQAAKPTAPSPAPSSQDDESLPPPFNLPTASRARMRECGESWQAIKIAGRAASETWRAFATRCLARKDAPEKSTQP